MDEFEDEADTDYNFIVTALCPVNLRIDGLVYDEQDNSIAKKESCDRIVELPSDGFLFPIFNDRAPDINGVLYYTKNAKKPNTSVVEELLVRTKRKLSRISSQALWVMSLTMILSLL